MLISVWFVHCSYVLQAPSYMLAVVDTMPAGSMLTALQDVDCTAATSERQDVPQPPVGIAARTMLTGGAVAHSYLW